MDEQLILKIENALNQIRPYLQQDGGNVKLVDVTGDMIARVELLGACGSCPISYVTLKAGVEKTLLQEVPELKGVESINPNNPDFY